MAEGAWWQVSHVLAMLANINRDNGEPIRQPQDFNVRLAPRPRSKEEIAADKEDARDRYGKYLDRQSRKE